MSNNYTHCVTCKIVWGLEVPSLWLGDKPGEEGNSVTPLVLQVYCQDHTGSLDNLSMVSSSEFMNDHPDLLIGTCCM